MMFSCFLFPNFLQHANKKQQQKYGIPKDFNFFLDIDCGKIGCWGLQLSFFTHQANKFAHPFLREKK